MLLSSAVSKSMRVLIQAAFQFPACFGVFRVPNGITFSSAAQGKAAPGYLWHPKDSKGAWPKVSHANTYLDLAPGTNGTELRAIWDGKQGCCWTQDMLDSVPFSPDRTSPFRLHQSP